ncbi:MAG: polyisoprenoid-binding protein [Thermomonas sp.]|nr:MAG: polyisoprenoid-binding protein [Thermomonas sp.]
MPLATVIAACCACATAHAGEPPRYVIDPVHTRVLFEIDHAGFSKAIGTVSGSEGSLHFDADDWSTAKLEVTVPMQRLDMGDSGWSASVFAPRFLDIKRYPQARFVSTRVERHEGNRGTVCGELTLHGTTRPLCMALVLNRIARYPLPPFRRTAGFSARASLKRSDFGMTSWRSLVGDEVELRIEAELFRRNGDDPPPAAVDAPPSTTPDPIPD